MKVYKDLSHIVLSGDELNEISTKIAKCIEEYQKRNMQVDVQYSTSANNRGFIFSALILAYTEE